METFLSKVSQWLTHSSLSLNGLICITASSVGCDHEDAETVLGTVMSDGVVGVFHATLLPIFSAVLIIESNIEYYGLQNE